MNNPIILTSLLSMVDNLCLICFYAYVVALCNAFVADILSKLKSGAIINNFFMCVSPCLSFQNSYILVFQKHKTVQ